MSKAAQRSNRSDAYGFFGVISAHVADPAAAFDEASKMIAHKVGSHPKEVWAFLDSRHGRLFADDVAIEIGRTRDFRASVSAVVERWQEWKMARRGRTAKEGPYLASVVLAECHAHRVSTISAFHQR